MAIELPSDATRTSEEFHRLLASGRGRAHGARVVGVEHEYVVRRGDEQIDFSQLVGEIDVDGRALHPTNPHVRWLRSGAVLMADGKVAEIATPPVRAGPGVTVDVDARATHAADELAACLGTDEWLSGGSTHLSVQVDPARANELALLYARTYAAPLMLLMDRSDSPGMLVRPRPGRLEFCGEYVTGAALRAALGFALATTVALERALRDGSPQLALLDVTLEPGRRRFGWYVDRRAFGVDLYAGGRATRLPLAGGGRVPASDYLVAAWESAADAAAEILDADERRLVDDVVRGVLPIPLEGVCPGEAAPSDVAPSVHGVALEPVIRAGVTVEPVSATWDWMAFAIEGDGPRTIALVPRDDIASFRDEFRRGGLDEVVRRYRDLATGARDLHFHAQTGVPGLHDSVSPGPALLPTDHYGVGAGPASRTRPGKRLPPSPEPPPAGTKGNGGAVAVLGAVVLVLALALAVFTPSRPARAGTPAAGDPRLQIEGVDGVIAGDGELWVRVTFAEPWGELPPRDLFSAYFGIWTYLGSETTMVGWQWHAGVEEPLFDLVGRPLGGAILADGSVMMATGVFPGDRALEVEYETGSWVDEQTTGPVYTNGLDSIFGDNTAFGDPLSDFGAPVYDLSTGRTLTVPTTTSSTTTTAATTTTAPASAVRSTTTAPSTGATTTVDVVDDGLGAPTTGVTVATTTRPTTVPASAPSDGDGREPGWLILVGLGIGLITIGWWLRRGPTVTGTSPPPGGTPIGSTPAPTWLLFEKGNDRASPRVMS